jgi:hypothetical protein
MLRGIVNRACRPCGTRRLRSPLASAGRRQEARSRIIMCFPVLIASYTFLDYCKIWQQTPITGAMRALFIYLYLSLSHTLSFWHKRRYLGFRIISRVDAACQSGSLQQMRSSVIIFDSRTRVIKFFGSRTRVIKFDSRTRVIKFDSRTRVIIFDSRTRVIKFDSGRCVGLT